MSVIEFRGENIILETNTDERNIKISKVLEGGFTSDTISALDNSKANNDNKFSVNQNIDETISSIVAKAPTDFPKIFTESGILDIKVSGNYVVHGVGGGGAGGTASVDDVLPEKTPAGDTIFQVGDMKIIGAAGISGTDKGGIPKIHYDEETEIGGLKGGDIGEMGEDGPGMCVGGSYGDEHSGGGGAGGLLYDENGLINGEHGVGGRSSEGGQGYGAGGGACIAYGSQLEAGGGSSGHSNKMKVYLEKGNVAIITKIGRAHV